MNENKGNKKEVRIAEIHLRNIERIIGTTVESGEAGKFANFLDVDELTQSRLRDIYTQADELRAKAYLTYLLPKHFDRNHIFSFLFNVIIEGMSQEDWEKNNRELNGYSCWR